jgi:hypothetical protein
LLFGYDWRRQRFSQFPNANTDTDGYIDGDCHSNGNGKCNRNTACHTNGYSECYRHCDADPYTEGSSNYPNTPAPPDASSSPVGRVAALLCKARTWAPENG